MAIIVDTLFEPRRLPLVACHGITAQQGQRLRSLAARKGATSEADVWVWPCNSPIQSITPYMQALTLTWQSDKPHALAFGTAVCRLCHLRGWGSACNPQVQCQPSGTVQQQAFLVHAAALCASLQEIAVRIRTWVKTVVHAGTKFLRPFLSARTGRKPTFEHMVALRTAKQLTKSLEPRTGKNNTSMLTWCAAGAREDCATWPPAAVLGGSAPGSVAAWPPPKHIPSRETSMLPPAASAPAPAGLLPAWPASPSMLAPTDSS